MPKTPSTPAKPEQQNIKTKTNKGFAKGSSTIPTTTDNEDSKVFVLGYN